MGAPNHNIGTTVGTVAMPGIGTVLGMQYDEGKQGARDAQDQVDAETARQQGIINERNANIDKIREAFGIGSSTTAHDNATRLGDTINQYYNDYLSQNLHSVDDQYAAASRTSRQNLARVGQLGSGLDSANRSTTLADYLRGRQEAVAKAGSAKDSLSASLANQRMGFENQISGGGANPDFAGVANQQQALLSSAQSAIPSNAIGNLFSIAGQTYMQGAQQQAAGNQGLSAFGFSNNNNSGRIS